MLALDLSDLEETFTMGTPSAAPSKMSITAKKNQPVTLLDISSLSNSLFRCLVVWQGLTTATRHHQLDPTTSVSIESQNFIFSTAHEIESFCCRRYARPSQAASAKDTAGHPCL
jgi:hypothetical protein